MSVMLKESILRPVGGRSSPQAELCLFASSWTLLAVVVPILASGNDRGIWSTTLALLWLVVAYGATRLSFIFARGKPAWFDALFWTFTYIWIGLATFTQFANHRNPYGLSLTEDSYQSAAILALVGMLAFDVGRALGKLLPAPKPRRHKREIDKSRTIWVGSIALVASLVIVNYLGGWQVLFLTRNERSATLVESGLRTSETGGLTAIAATVMICGPLISFLAWMRLGQNDPSLRAGIAWWIFGGLLLGAVLILANPISSSRFWSGTAYASVLLSLALARRAAGFRVTLAGLFALLLLAFPYLDYFRNKDTYTRLQSMVDIITTKGDYDTAVQMVNVVDLVQSQGIEYGKQIVGTIFFFVPRNLWPGKPQGTGAEISLFINYPMDNLSSPLWVEGYIDGGLIGAALLLGLAGLAASWLQSEGLTATSQLLSLRVLLLPPVAAYSLILLRGSLMSNIGGLVAILAFGWLVTRRVQEQPKVIDLKSHSE